MFPIYLNGLKAAVCVLAFWGVQIVDRGEHTSSGPRHGGAGFVVLFLCRGEKFSIIHVFATLQRSAPTIYLLQLLHF